MRITLLVLRIANAGTVLQTWDMPVTLADRLGYYKDEGLDVTLENLPSTTKALEAVLGGSADVAVCTYAQALHVVAQGQRIRSFFVLTKRDIKVLVVAPAARDRTRRFEDLKGALIGVPAIGSAAHLWVKYYEQLGQNGSSNKRILSSRRAFTEALKT